MIEWAVISAAVLPHIKKYASEEAEKLAKDSADKGIAKLYRRLVPDEKLVKATEAFVVRFNKELDSAADLPTLTLPAYQEALKTFLSDPDVLEALETPLDAQSPLDVEMLSSRWRYLRTADSQPLIELPADFDWGKLAKRYGEALRTQALANPELRQIVLAKASLRTAQATERMAGPAKTFDLTAYAAAVKQSYRYLRLGSLDADWVAYENKVRLESVYVPQSAKQALPPRDLTRDYLRSVKIHGVEVSEDELQQQKRLYDELKAIPILEIVDDPGHNRLIVLGDPGLGKSTLLKYLALRWAQDSHDPLALLIELRRTIQESGQMDFLEYLEKGPGLPVALPALELAEQLKRHESLILLDGLDEVVESRRGDVVSRVISFAREYPKARIIVTTRIHGYYPGSSYPEQFRDADFQQFTLQDFGKQDIDRFVMTWHQEAFRDPVERSRYETRLRSALEDSPAISELAVNPLLLTMMAILNRVQDLPRDRSRLYEKCAELLLKNWDLEKFPELMEKRDTRDIKDKLGPDQKMRILELVAKAMQEERTGLAGNIIGEKKLKDIIQAQLRELDVSQPWAVTDDLIWMLRERNFMLAYLGDHQFAFVHRTFLEYYCAREIKYRLEKTSSLSADQLAVVFREHWHQDEWREVLSLLCGMIGPEYAGRGIDELLKNDDLPPFEALFLAARCLEEIREQGSLHEARERIRLRLINLTRSLVDTFALEAFNYLFVGWGQEAWIQAWLENQALNNMHESARVAAMEMLAQGWKNDAGMNNWLKKCAKEGPGTLQRRRAVELLAEGWNADSWVIDWCKDLAVDDANEDVRSTAVRLVATHAGNVPWITSWLQERVRSDRHEYVRSASLEHLARRCKGENSIIEWLLQRAQEDPSEYVRRNAAAAFAQSWNQESWILEWLKKMSVNDTHEYVRAAVLIELANHWSHEACIIEWLKDRARWDSAPLVREVAFQLAHGNRKPASASKDQLLARRYILRQRDYLSPPDYWTR